MGKNIFNASVIGIDEITFVIDFQALIFHVGTSMPRARIPIESNLPCADCDPQSAGGGSGYYPPNDPTLSKARSQPIKETGEPDVDLCMRPVNRELGLMGRRQAKSTSKNGPSQRIFGELLNSLGVTPVQRLKAR